jgi:hypothetical protein
MKTKLGLLLIIIICICAISCKKERVLEPKNVPITPQEIGGLHNKLLSEIDNLLVLDDFENIDDYSKKENEYIISKVSENLRIKIENFTLDKDYPRIANDYIFENVSRQSKGFYEAYDDFAKESILEFRGIVNDSNFKSIVSSSEIELISQVLTNLEKYIENKDLSSLRNQMGVIKESIYYSNFNEDLGEGFLLNTLISVADSSIVYWTETYPKSDSQSKGWFLVSDAVGALLGAGQSMLADALNGNEVDWSDAAVSALIGGVGFSLPGGKSMGKLIKKAVEAVTK